MYVYLFIYSTVYVLIYDCFYFDLSLQVSMSSRLSCLPRGLRLPNFLQAHPTGSLFLKDWDATCNMRNDAKWCMTSGPPGPHATPEPTVSPPSWPCSEFNVFQAKKKGPFKHWDGIRPCSVPCLCHLLLHGLNLLTILQAMLLKSQDLSSDQSCQDLHYQYCAESVLLLSLSLSLSSSECILPMPCMLRRRVQ